jgi:hypothetical protein
MAGGGILLPRRVWPGVARPEVRYICRGRYWAGKLGKVDGVFARRGVVEVLARGEGRGTRYTAHGTRRGNHTNKQAGCGFPTGAYGREEREADVV